MKGKKFYFWFGCLIALLGCPTVFACSCGPRPLDNDQYNRAYTFMVGEIVEVTKGKLYEKYDTLILKIKVEQSWKQKVDRTITLPLLDWKDFCGDLNPVVGKKYFLRTFKTKRKIDPVTIWGECGLSRLLEYAQSERTFLTKKAHWSYSQ